MLGSNPTEGLDGFSTVSPTAFVNATLIFPMSPRPLIDSNCPDLEIKYLIDTYARTLDAGDREEAIFFSLVNYILARAYPDNMPHVKFVTTDTKRIFDSRRETIHSPDAVVVLENYTSCKGFGWKRVLSTFEFRLRQIRRPRRCECGRLLTEHLNVR